MVIAVNPGWDPPVLELSQRVGAELGKSNVAETNIQQHGRRLDNL